MEPLDHNPMDGCVTGTRYVASLPDTLDLAERMALALNALTNVWFPKERWALGFNVDFSRRPAALIVNHLTDAYLNIPPKFIEALALCRLGSGCRDNLDTDREVISAQLSLVGDDGLSYTPADTLSAFTELRPFSEVWGEGRMLVALSVIAQLDDDPRWVALGKRKIDRLLALTRERDGYRFLWKGRFRPGEEPPPDADEPRGRIEGGSLADGGDPVFSLIYSVGALGHGSALFARATGYEPALELSRGMARWAIARVFRNEDGRYDFWHFHHGLYALMAVCQYGLAAGDRDALERVDACYRWAREMGDPLVGFYAEHMPGCEHYLARRGNTVEICEVADMVFLALMLTRAGLGDYWDDVDRWVRNLYTEGQLRDASFLERIPEHYFADASGNKPYEDTTDIPRRSVGSFFGWMRGNDGLTVHRTEAGPKLAGHSIMHCCTANGARTLFSVWDSILTRTAEETRVNLLLNRASPWLDVESFLPVEGKVVLRIKDAPRIAVRVPEWCPADSTAVHVNDRPRRPVIEGQWMRLGWLRPRDLVQVTFPMPERTVHRVLGEMPYTLVLRGSNVVSINPPGLAYPLYADQPTGRLATRTRYVPPRTIVW